MEIVAKEIRCYLKSNDDLKSICKSMKEEGLELVWAKTESLDGFSVLRFENYYKTYRSI